MRFFKAFNLLHRRTKSETFIPGFIHSDPQAALYTDSRPSWPPVVLGPNKFGQSEAVFSSIFDFATSKYTPVPPTFSHLRGVHHATYARATVTVGHRPSTGRDSQSSIPSLMVEENMRLREALDLWFQEYSKVDELLQKCRAELAFERERIRSLQQEAVRDQEVIIKLREDLTHRETDKGLSLVCLREYCSHDRGDGSHTSNALLLPAPSESVSSLKIPGNLRTLGDYTSALRLTLNTRRRLRDQKKISKFWKAKALSTGKCNEIITPSTSAISSVHESLPPGRQAAVEAFMRQRGLPLPQTTKVVAQVEIAPASGASHMDTDSDPNITQILFPTLSKSSGLCVIHSSASIAPLPSTPSKGSGVSRIHSVARVAQTLSSASSVPRLAPLASESLKAEINLFFGIQDTAGRLSSLSKKRQPGSGLLSAGSSSLTMGPSSSRLSNILRADNLNLSFGSYGDLVSSLFFRDFPPRVKLPTQSMKDSHATMQPTTSEIDGISQRLSLPSSSGLANTSISSGFSGEALAVLNTDEMPRVLHSVNAINQTSKMTRPSGRSWQKYLAPASGKKNTGKQKAKKVAAGKENALSFAKPMSLFRKSASKGV